MVKFHFKDIAGNKHIKTSSKAEIRAVANRVAVLFF